MPSRQSEENPADLVARASRQEPEALAALLERHLPQLRMYLRLHAAPNLTRRESIDDFAQSVCREVLEELPGFDYRGEPSFRKWLFLKAKSKLVDRWRYHAADKRAEMRETTRELDELRASFLSASELAIRREDQDELERAFQALGDEYRDVIVRARLYGQPHAQIAAETGRSEGAVRMLLHRALVRLAWIVRDGKQPEA